MRELLVTSQFKKDLKKAKKRRKDLSKLESILDKLISSEALGPKTGPIVLLVIGSHAENVTLSQVGF